GSRGRRAVPATQRSTRPAGAHASRTPKSQRTRADRRARRPLSVVRCQRPSSTTTARLQLFTSDEPVVERNRDSPGGLSGFVTLAGDHDDVAPARACERTANRLPAIELHFRRMDTAWDAGAPFR